MTFVPFKLEYVQSTWEQIVDFNLTESGVHPLRLEELIGDDDHLLGRLLETEINYPHVNGNPALRQNIARLYHRAEIDNVLVTVGAAEANHIAVQTLLEPGDEILTQRPTYQQVWGLSLNAGHCVKSFDMIPEEGWALDIDELNRKLSKHTKIIAICNPNNPTGYIMTEPEMEAVVTAADKVGAWILADEVYRGAERLQEDETASFFGRYDRVLSLGSMSKAYGLPGLRIGWVVAPPTVIDDLWRRHEYTTIAATMLSNELAAHALSPNMRPRLIGRTRNYIRRGYPVLESWLDRQNGLFSCVAPQASAVAFIRYHLDMGSTELMELLCREASVFVAAGDSFGMDNYLRIAFGQEQPLLEQAFERIRRLIVRLRP